MTIKRLFMFTSFFFALSMLAMDASAARGAGRSDGGSSHGGFRDRDGGSRGERNYDEETIEGIEDARNGGNGTPVDQLGIGEPNSPNYSYNRDKEELRDRR